MLSIGHGGSPYGAVNYKEMMCFLIAISTVIFTVNVNGAVIGLDENERKELSLSMEMDYDYGTKSSSRYGKTKPVLRFPPSSILTVSTNPLRDQPNLSTGRTTVGDQIIYGSRKAFTVTKLEYLKKEWCKTEPLKQVIREEGCLQRTVVNRFCYGQCNSFFIPKSNKKDLESAAFKSCSFCKPKRYSWITVTLRCPTRKPKFKRKRIQMIKQCKCMAQKLD